MNNKYFQITYDFDKLSDDEQKAVIEQAQQGFKDGKVAVAGWESIAKVENNGWISIDNPPQHSDRYLCQVKSRNGEISIEINYLYSDDNTYNKRILGVTHWQYLPDEVESENE